MPNSRHWEYGTRAAARRIQEAFAVAAGLPKKTLVWKPGSRVDEIPDEYAQGALGWTGELVEVDSHPTLPGRFALQRAPECEPYEGNDVDVGGDIRRLPTLAGSVLREPDWWPPGPPAAEIPPGFRGRGPKRGSRSTG